MAELTHFDPRGNARMVDVSAKAETERVAIARGAVQVSAATMQRIVEGGVKKGDVLAVAQLAGIMGAKRTAELIPLCHPIALEKVEVQLEPDPASGRIEILATCASRGRTGVEMEALTAVAVAALTVYDMVKAIEREARIVDIRLVHKAGGKSGAFQAEQ